MTAADQLAADQLAADSVPAQDPGKLLAHYPGCYGCGTANQHGLRLRVHWTGSAAILDHVVPPAAEGAPGVAHGGHLSAIVDEVTALVVAEHTGEPAVTRRMELDFHAPTPVGTPIRLRSWVEEQYGRRVIVRLAASLAEAPPAAPGPETLFAAKGVFFTVPRGMLLALMAKSGRSPDRVDWGDGDPSTFLRWQLTGGLDEVFVATRLDREIRLDLEIVDADPGRWSLLAGPGGLEAAEGLTELPDVRFTGRFKEWQRLIRGSVSLGSLVAGDSVRIEGSTGALQNFVTALDFERFA